MSKTQWYSGGLSFECIGCGRCCCGPEQGYIWANADELKFIADYLKIDINNLKSEYTKKIGFRRSLIEQKITNDCIFLKDRKSCSIYQVRPNQCRTWPFWNSNLQNPQCWNQAAIRCPGINRGRRFSFDEIEALRLQKKWY